MAVRTIIRKLTDIAEAAWEEGDRHPEGDEYGQIGDVADRRIARLSDQIKGLAMEAVSGRYHLSPEGRREVMTSPRLEHILASALIGDWAEVEKHTVNARAISEAFERELYGCATIDFRVELKPRDPGQPSGCTCCGGSWRWHEGWCLNK